MISTNKKVTHNCVVMSAIVSCRTQEINHHEKEMEKAFAAQRSVDLYNVLLVQTMMRLGQSTHLSLVIINGFLYS